MYDPQEEDEPTYFEVLVVRKTYFKVKVFAKSEQDAMDLAEMEARSLKPSEAEDEEHESLECDFFEDEGFYDPSENINPNED